MLFTALIVQPQPVRAGGLESIQSAGNGLLAWFISFRAPLDTVVAREKRDQLRRRLSQLSRTLYATEQTIEDLIRYLEQPGTDRTRLNAKVDELSNRVDAFRAALLSLGPLLREERRAGGEAVETQLRRASMSRANLVMRIRMDVADPAKRPALAAEGKTTLAVLIRANKELAAVIRRLR